MTSPRTDPDQGMHTRLNGNDVKLIKDLQVVTGLRGRTEVMRLALRALYKQQTGRDWRPGDAGEVNGQAAR